MTQLDPLPTSESPSDSATGHRIGRRSLLGGMAVLGAAGIVSVSRTMAQEATPTAPAEPDGVGGATDTDKQAQIAEHYQLFVSQFAANLGVDDPATVDTAIRNALKAMVDEELAASEISRNEADALKAGIDESTSPLKVGVRFRHNGGSRDGRPSDRDVDGADDSTTPPTEATPMI